MMPRTLFTAILVIVTFVGVSPSRTKAEMHTTNSFVRSGCVVVIPVSEGFWGWEFKDSSQLVRSELTLQIISGVKTNVLTLAKDGQIQPSWELVSGDNGTDSISGIYRSLPVEIASTSDVVLTLRTSLDLWGWSPLIKGYLPAGMYKSRLMRPLTLGGQMFLREWQTDLPIIVTDVTGWLDRNRAAELVEQSGERQRKNSPFSPTSYQVRQYYVSSQYATQWMSGTQRNGDAKVVIEDAIKRHLMKLGVKFPAEARVECDETKNMLVIRNQRRYLDLLVDTYDIQGKPAFVIWGQRGSLMKLSPHLR